MKRKTKPAFVLLMVVAAILQCFMIAADLLVSPYIVFPISNDIILCRFSWQLLAGKLPDETRLLDSASVCGKLNGNGNGMDFLAAALIQTDLPLSEIRKYYHTQSYQAAKPFSDHACEVIVIPAESPELQTEFLEHRDIAFPNHTKAIAAGGCYYVILYDGGYTAPFDIRGH